LKPEAFISYSSQDAGVASAICAHLEEAGIGCWIAPRDINAGQKWSEAIMMALEQSRVMILVLSPASNSSEQVEREVERAASRRLPILPLRLVNVPLSKSLEYFISTPHWLDASELPLERHLPKLVQAVRMILGTPAGASVAPALAGGDDHRLAGSPTSRAHQQTSSQTTRPTRWRGGLIACAGLVAIGGLALWINQRTASNREMPNPSIKGTEAVPAAEKKPEFSDATNDRSSAAPVMPATQVSAEILDGWAALDAARLKSMDDEQFVMYLKEHAPLDTLRIVKPAQGLNVVRIEGSVLNQADRDHLADRLKAAGGRVRLEVRVAPDLVAGLLTEKLRALGLKNVSVSKRADLSGATQEKATAQPAEWRLLVSYSDDSRIDQDQLKSTLSRYSFDDANFTVRRF
jgi:hypothetical protein